MSLRTSQVLNSFYDSLDGGCLRYLKPPLGLVIFLEGLTEHSKTVKLTVTIYYSKRIRIKVSKEESA